MLKQRILSFKFAFEGIGYVLRTQPNAWIHALITLVVIIVSFWLSLDNHEWALLILTIVVVWMAEMSNTAIEAVVDLLSPEIQQKAKIAKDVSAGVVLISAIGAIIVGTLIIGPRIFEKLFPA
jgi:diacylglycerol kinase